MWCPHTFGCIVYIWASQATEASFHIGMFLIGIGLWVVCLLNSKTLEACGQSSFTQECVNIYIYYIHTVKLLKVVTKKLPLYSIVYHFKGVMS